MAMRAMELFLAPESNPRVRDSFDLALDSRRDVADTLYGLSDDALMEVARAHRNLDKGQLEKALTKVSTELNALDRKDLADAMMWSMPYMDSIIAENSASRAILPNRVMATPNVGLFVSFLSFFEELGRMVGMTEVTLIFDDSTQYNEAFGLVFRDIKAGKYPLISRATTSKDPRYYGLQVMSDFRTASSEVEPLIQAADVLTSIVCRYATDICLGQEPVPESKAALDLTMPIMEGERRLHRLVGSQRFVDRFLAGVEGA